MPKAKARPAYFRARGQGRVTNEPMTPKRVSSMYAYVEQLRE